jgi:glycosyltransferase involved in cell wall biosynthesis
VIHGHGLAERTPPFDVARDVGYVSGACLAIRRELWWDLGGFDPRYAPAYYEDTDLCLAARLRGWRIRWTPDARVIHLGGQSYGRTSARKDALLESSRHAFRAKWGRELERLASDGWHGPVLPLAPAATRGALVVVERHCVRADLDGGSVHLVQVLRELVRDRWEIAYLPLDRDLRSEAAESLRRMGIRVVADAGHAATVLDRAPTAIIVRRPDSLGSLVLELVQRWPAAALVYDTVDLHEDRLRMEAERRGDGADRVARVTAAVERAGLVAADLVVAVSEEEAAVVAERVPGATVVVAPPSFPLTADVAPRAGRTGMLLLGSYRHPPNIDAARRLATRVLPLVRAERPAAFATLAGTYPPMDLLVLRDRHGVAVPGYVADLDALHHAHVACVAPLEWGAGANGKLIAAMAAGLPVVTTTFGAIGLAARDGEHLLVADSDADLAAAYLRLEVDDDLWSRLSAGGRALVRDRYEPGVAYGALCAWLRERAPAR